MMEQGILPNGLLEDVKNYLNITWQDDATDTKIGGIIASGVVEADYTQNGMPRTLLFEYVRYVRDSALDVFENNYQALLLGMQNDRAVKAYVESAETTE